MWAILKCIPLVFKCQPELVLVNGPSTCVPVVLVTKLLSSVKMVPPIKIIFIESVCRVKSLSLSAKLLWYFLDDVIVQWPEMTEFAPKKVEEAKGQIEDTVAGLEDDKVGAEAKFKEKMEKQQELIRYNFFSFVLTQEWIKCLRRKLQLITDHVG